MGAPVSPFVSHAGRARNAVLGSLCALALACAAQSTNKTGEPPEAGDTGGREATGGGGGTRATGGKGADPTGGAGGQQPTSTGGASATGGSSGTPDGGSGGSGTGGGGGSGLPPVTGMSRKVSTVQQFTEAVAASKPGDEIVFANGTYSDFRLELKGSGTEAAPILLRAETPGQVIFHGKSQLFIDGDWLVVSGFKYEQIADVPNITTPYDVVVGAVVTFRKTTNHARLTETAIVDSGSKVSGYFHMEPGGQYNRVDHCWFSGQKDIGPSLYIEVDPTKPNNAVLESSFIGNRAQGNGNRWETLRIGHAEQQKFKSGALVTRNYFNKCDGENEMISNKSTGNKYLYNALVENHGELTLRHGDEVWIEGNFLDRSTGIRVIGARHVIINNYLKKLSFGFNIYAAEANPPPAGYAPVIDAIIAFNTLEDCGTAFQIGTSGRPVAPKNVRVGYNLVQASGGILEYSNASSDIKYEGNIMYGGNLAARAGVSRDKPAMLADQLGRLVVDRSKLAMMVDAKSFPQVTKDLDGAERGTMPNVGAIQSPNVKPLYPLSPKDVGPLWMGRVDTAQSQQRLLLSAVSNSKGGAEILLPEFDGHPVTLEVLDGAGRLVRTLEATSDRTSWDGRDEHGRSAAGSYVVRAIVRGQVATRALQLSGR